MEPLGSSCQGYALPFALMAAKMERWDSSCRRCGLSFVLGGAGAAEGQQEEQQEKQEEKEGEGAGGGENLTTPTRRAGN